MALTKKNSQYISDTSPSCLKQNRIIMGGYGANSIDAAEIARVVD